MRIINFIKSVYLSEGSLTPKDYKTSRVLSIFEGGSARLIFTLTSGAFLAGFAEYLGASDQFNGILAAIPALAGVIQIFSPIVFERMERRKAVVVSLCFMHRLLLGLMVFIPLLVPDSSARLALIAAIYLAAYLMVSFITPAASNWIVTLTPSNIRGKFFSLREMCILASVTVISLISGSILDSFKESGSQYTGFIIVFSFAILLSLANFIFFSAMKEPPVPKSKSAIKLSSVLRLPLKDKSFRKIIILFFLWNIGLQIGGPFFAVYMKTGLDLDYTFIMFMGIISSIINVITVRLWGKLADKKSWAYTTKMSIGLLGVTHLLWFFVDKSTAFMLLPVFHVASGAAWAGINISIFNIQFEFSPEEGRTMYLGFAAALGGLIGFISALAGAAIIGILNDLRLTLLGVSIGSTQVIFALSGVVLASCAAYIHYCIKKGR